MKLRKLQKVLLCGAIAMGVLSYTSNASAAALPSKRVVVQTSTTEGKDKFEIVENRIGGKKPSYELSQRTKDNVMYFTVTTDPGTTLGDLENSANRIDSEKKLEDGRTEYKFHYTLFNYEPVRKINISVTE